MIAAPEPQVNMDGKWKMEEVGKHYGWLCPNPHKRAKNWISVGVKKKNAEDNASVEKKHFHALLFVIVEDYAPGKIWIQYSFIIEVAITKMHLTIIREG